MHVLSRTLCKQNGKLAIVNPNVTVIDLPKSYPGETLTFDGIVVDNKDSQIEETENNNPTYETNQDNSWNQMNAIKPLSKHDKIGAIKF